MTGNDTRSLVLQDRDRHLLKELAMMRVIDREQAKLVAGFGSTTRVNTRLLRLNRAGLLKRFFTGTIAGGRKGLYALLPKGAALAGAPYRAIQRKTDELLVNDLFLEHQLAINGIFIILKYRPVPVPGVRLLSWKTFQEQISQALPLIPDAYFELATPTDIRPMFLEVDRGTETLKTWKKKIEAYLKLAVSGEFASRFHQAQFRVLVVAPSERRCRNIRSTVATYTDKVFWFSTIEFINRDGFWSPIWLRPNGERKQSLI
jgi:hypothetical protein